MDEQTVPNRYEIDDFASALRQILLTVI